MDKENTNPNTGPKCEECNITFKKENEKYKHNYNFHQKNVISEADGVLCEMRTNQAGFYTCMECKDKIKGYELLKRHYNKRHTSSILCNNKRNFTEFTFEEGCERQGIEAKKSKAVHLVKGVGMVPTMLSLLDEDENNVYHLYNTIEEVKARKIQDLKLFEKDLTCQLKIYNNNSSESSDKVEIVPSRALYFYDFPAFNEKMGEYIVIDEEIECKLNKKKQDFFSVSKLFIGGLIYFKNVTLMILTVEVYPRDVSIDSHAESSYASFPQTIDVNDRYYKSIKTIIISQSEGGQPINKLIIGTSSLNILVTSTFKLTPRCNEMSTAGPAAPSVLNGNDLSNAQILFRKVNAEEYINETTSTKFDIALCRQLTSGIDDESTYLPYRCNLFDSLTLQPITIFTLHKLPLIGFSLSKTNSSRKTSMFFSAIAKCIVKKNGNFEMKKLDKLIKVNIKNQDLDPILASLEEKMKDSKEGGICIIDFLSQQKGLSKLAQSLSGPISTANKKIQTNITTFLSDYFKRN